VRCVASQYYILVDRLSVCIILIFLSGSIFILPNVVSCCSIECPHCVSVCTVSCCSIACPHCVSVCTVSCCSIACPYCVSVCTVSSLTFCGKKLLKTWPTFCIHIHATCLSRPNYLVLTILAILGKLCKLRSFSLRIFRNDEICSQWQACKSNIQHQYFSRWRWISS
jgi:hypothetical protein